jgi:hypothetical protein
MTATAHVDGDQASSKKIASLGYRLPDDLIEPCGENRRVQEGACSRCAAANFESRMMPRHILQTPTHCSKQLTGSLRNTSSMSSLGRQFMMHFSCPEHPLAIFFEAIPMRQSNNLDCQGKKSLFLGSKRVSANTDRNR